MSRLRMGYKAGVGPVVKVMASGADDPFTTPNTDWHKFRFNSEIEALGYVTETIHVEIDFTGFAEPVPTTSWANIYWPPGSTYETCWVHLTMRRNNFNNHYFWGAWPMVANLLPDWEERFTFVRAATTDWRQRWFRTSNPVQIQIRPESRIVRLNKPDPSGVFVNGVPTAQLASDDYTRGIYRQDTDPVKPGVLPGMNFFATDFPTDDVPYPPAGPTPNPNAHILRISPSVVRMARPGYDIGGADENMIFSAERVPMKVAAAGTATLSAGQTITVTPAVPVDVNCLVDFYAGPSGGPLTIPPFSGLLNEANLVAYRVTGGNVQFRNDATVPVSIVYAVFTEGTTPASTGNAKVVERLVDGHWVIRRPGTAGTSLKDEILNTKLSFLPVVAQGFIPHGAFATSDTPTYGTHMAVVDFANPGFKPFPLFCLKCERNVAPFDIEYRHVNINWLTASSPDRMSALSVFGVVTDTSLKIYCWRGTNNPTLVQTSPAPSIQYDAFSCIGIRYFVLAIPTSL